MALNGSISYPSPILDLLDPTPNGFDEPPIELLDAELPVVNDGQVQLSDLVSRIVQACYAEMTEMAETWVIPWIQLILRGSRFCLADHALQSSVFLACRIAHESASWLTLWLHGRSRW
jgi:hypothetical protein